MTPAVAEARQLALAAAGVVFDRELGDLEVLLGGPDHHLGGELHAGRAQVQARQDFAAHGPHAAVGVADAGAEEEVQQAGQDRVADVLVQPRHRPGLDVVHAVADHHLGARPPARRRSGESRRSRRSGRRRPSRCSARARRRSRPGRRFRSRGDAPRRHARRPLRRVGRSRPRSCCRPRPPRPARPMRDDRLEGRGDAGLDVLRLVEARDHDRTSGRLLLVARRAGRLLTGASVLMDSATSVGRSATRVAPCVITR